jgi:hypothetical protein
VIPYYVDEMGETRGCVNAWAAEEDRLRVMAGGGVRHSLVNAGSIIMC